MIARWIDPWIAMSLVIALLASLAIALHWAQCRFALHPEWPRKLLHVGTGLVVCTFPWVFARWWPVSTLAALSVLSMLVTQRVPRLRRSIGRVTGGVSRISFGEYYYPLAIGLLAPLAWGVPVLFVVPMLVLILADALAALVGLGYGRVKYVTFDGTKSIEGSVAFLTVAFLSVHVPLLLMTGVGRTESLLIGVMIALLAMMFEAAAWRGIDNLIVPLAVYALLQIYLPLDAAALARRVTITLVVVSFVMPFRSRATLDDSALIACALFGYGLIILGGPIAAVAPLTVFLGHMTMFPRISETRHTTVHAILSVAAAPLACLVAIARSGSLWPVLPLAVAMAAHWAFVWISYAPRGDASRVRQSSIPGGVATGVSFVLGPTLALLIRSIADFTVHDAIVAAIASTAAISIAAITFARLRRTLYVPRPRMRLIHAVGGILAAVCAAVATGVVHVNHRR